MSDLREAAQQALDEWRDDPGSVRMASMMMQLRAALEQPPCEIAEDGVCETLDCCGNPPRREWQGLTEEDAAACWSASAVDTWKAIEAALKEKNT